jgi:hypothetical protein
MSDDPKPSGKKAVVNEAFEKLQPLQKQQIKETYLLSQSLFMQNKFALYVIFALDRVSK